MLQWLSGDEQVKKCARLASLPLLWQKLLGKALEQQGKIERLQKDLQSSFHGWFMYAGMYALKRFGPCLRARKRHQHCIHVRSKLLGLY